MTAHAAAAGDTDPLFRAVVADQLTYESLTDLAAGTIGALRVTGFLSPTICRNQTASIDPRELAPFDPARYQPAAHRLGVVLNEFRQPNGIDEAYWLHAKRAEAFWRSAPGGDVRQMCLDKVRAIWPQQVGPAVGAGRALFWGVLREVNQGMPSHWDDVNRELPAGFLQPRPVLQLVVNTYLAMPERGGETVIWCRRWHPSDERHRSGYGYSESLCLNEQSMVVRCRAGDALFFDPRNYHAVRPVTAGRRLAIAFYLGLCADGQLTVWS